LRWRRHRWSHRLEHVSPRQFRGVNIGAPQPLQIVARVAAASSLMATQAAHTGTISS
jgi:hypothetical protein